MKTKQKPPTLKQCFLIYFLASILNEQLPETILSYVPLPFQIQNWVLAACFSPALSQEGTQLLKGEELRERRAAAQQ